MKTIATLLLSVAGFGATAQTTISNGGFESWGGNASPGVTAEPTGWYSNKSGSDVAKLGPQTCFQDNTIFHTGTSSVRVENASFFGTVVNGNVTTGVINAPTTTKSDGYIGTVNYSTPTDVRHRAFTGRPDSLTGWYQYTKGGNGEKGKVRAILHTGEYFDPETPSTYHIDPTANKIGEILFYTDTNTISTWTRFSVPFTYTSAATPAYIMINITSSADQTTTYSGSKLWIDDLTAIYNTPSSVTNTVNNDEHATVYSNGHNVFVTATNGSNSPAVLSVFDMAGRNIFEGSIPNNQPASFSLNSAATGMYIYQLTNGGSRKTGRIFIQQ